MGELIGTSDYNVLLVTLAARLSELNASLVRDYARKKKQ